MSRLRAGADLVTFVLACFLLPCVVTWIAVTVYAQATGQPPAPAVTETNEWGASVVYAWLTASGLEFLKRQKWFSVVSEKTAWWTQRLLGIVMAAATAAGIHYSFDAAAGTLVITGLVLSSITTALFDTLRQFVFQEFLYRTSIKTYKPVTTG